MTDTTTVEEKGHFRKHWLFYTLTFFAIAGAGYIWISKTIEVKRQAAQFENEKIALTQQAQESFSENSERNMSLMMTTFVWAVRSEMTRGNEEQVDQYFRQLVKSEKVAEIILADPEGKILLASNKKNEGNQITSEYGNIVQDLEEMTIINRGNIKIAAAPIMSVNRRIGNLLVVYQSDIFQIDQTIESDSLSN